MLNGPFTDARRRRVDAALAGAALDDRAAREGARRHAGHEHAGHRGHASLGKGTVAWLPWELGALYYRHSLPAHAGLFRDVVAGLYPQRQLKTNAHPLVEMTLMQQAGRTQLHLINLSGHSQTAYFPPVPMREIRVELRGTFHSARALRAPNGAQDRHSRGVL